MCIFIRIFRGRGDGAYALSQRIPHLLAACSPQSGNPNGISTINLCNCPIYIACGEKDEKYKRNKINLDYYNKIIEQNGKYLGKYIAKIELVKDSGHNFQCWTIPRLSYFNGSKDLIKTNDTAFTFMYSHKRNPYPTNISLDKKAFLTRLRNYYSPRGNTYYNIEIGKTTSDIIEVQINYELNSIIGKKGTNYKINLISDLFKLGDTIIVFTNGESFKYKLQKDINYAKNNMKLYCDPNYGFDSYITIGNFESEVNHTYLPKPLENLYKTCEEKIDKRAHAYFGNPTFYHMGYAQVTVGIRSQMINRSTMSC